MPRSSTDRVSAEEATWKAVLIGLGACALVTLAALPVAHALDHANIVMMYLLAVVLAAVWFGRTASLVAAFASVLSFDFFFVEPRFSFAVEDAQYLITFVVMLVVALIIAALTTRLRLAAERSAEREARTASLYRLARDISGALDARTVESLVAGFLDSVYGVDAEVLLIGSTGDLVGVSEAVNPRTDLAVSKRVLELGQALPFVQPETGAIALAMPLDAPVRRRGVLIVRARDDRDAVVPKSQRPLLDAVAALTSTAAERIHFAEVARETQVQMESERLRSSVLSAVSHDLRTPLTVMVGFADALARASKDAGPEITRPATELHDQALRLSRMVENLLEMARLRSGRVAPRKAWQPLEEVVGSSVRAVESAFPDASIAIDLPADLPLLDIDGVLIERVLVNLLENALKHAPGSAVEVRARRRDGSVDLAVLDRGPGLPGTDSDRLFDVFARGRAEDRVIGTGIGLAICKAIVEAHGGSIAAENRRDGGACFTVTLPADAPPIDLVSAAPPAAKAP
jgi:two-component system, OmpR family, sensor histidine kinase KdpD